MLGYREVTIQGGDAALETFNPSVNIVTSLYSPNHPNDRNRWRFLCNTWNCQPSTLLNPLNSKLQTLEPQTLSSEEGTTPSFKELYQEANTSSGLGCLVRAEFFPLGTRGTRAICHVTTDLVTNLSFDHRSRDQSAYVTTVCVTNIVTSFCPIRPQPFAVFFINCLPPFTQWSTTLLSKVELSHVIDLRASCGANLAT